MEGYDASTYGERFADVYDDWYADPAGTEAAAARLAVLAAGRPVLELGVGTGRLAVPLARSGATVSGVDASPAMLERLTATARRAGATVTTHLGDMAGPLPAGPFGLVFVARNTFFNLTSDEAQARCLAEVARVLAPGGVFVVEAFVPEASVERSSAVEVRDITADRVVLFVDRHDPRTQDAWSSYVEITPAGVRLRPTHIRYRTPAQLDAMAAAAGLALSDRWADWDASPFGDDSTSHVSLYRRASGR
ncbi:MAG: class I SAM-dependent methyltransferase [Actinobacteria bacterium]|nr:class I SAM-dependent methyltransferase [Actinomycetota bacterium]